MHLDEFLISTYHLNHLIVRGNGRQLRSFRRLEHLGISPIKSFSHWEVEGSFRLNVYVLCAQLAFQLPQLIVQTSKFKNISHTHMLQIWFSLRLSLLLYETFPTGSEDYLLTYSIIIHIYQISIHSVAIESCGNFPSITLDLLNEQNIDD